MDVDDPAAEADHARRLTVLGATVQHAIDHVEVFPAPDHVAGWTVVDRRSDRLVLGATSWHLEGRLVFEAEPGAARVTTLVRFRNPAGRAVWAVVAPLHRHAVPGILDAAHSRLTR